jgi:hypothetical protein
MLLDGDLKVMRDTFDDSIAAEEIEEIRDNCAIDYFHELCKKIKEEL